MKKDTTVHMIPCWDRQRRTCIQVERTSTRVKYIPLDVSEGLRVVTVPVDKFDQQYRPMEDYPIERACQKFLDCSQSIGATKEALRYLGQVVNVSKKEVVMATKKASVNATNAAKSVTKPAAKKEGRKMSAAQMFKDLIMQGKLTDDQIFEQVQAQFGLDEKKRGYVKWYRNYLKKQGLNPPAPKK